MQAGAWNTSGHMFCNPKQAINKHIKKIQARRQASTANMHKLVAINNKADRVTNQTLLVKLLMHDDTIAISLLQQPAATRHSILPEGTRRAATLATKQPPAAELPGCYHPHA